MMASNILSRLLPSGTDVPSIYDDSRQRDRRASTASAEHVVGSGIDEENLSERFHDRDLENMLADAAHSRVTTESGAFLPQTNARRPTTRQQPGSKYKPRWARRSPARDNSLDEDDNVPESLLLEGGRLPGAAAGRIERRHRAGAPSEDLPPPVPGPSMQDVKTQWEAARTVQPLHGDEPGEAAAPHQSRRARNSALIADPKEREMWRWTNVQKLDVFLTDVYAYYRDHGIWSILLSRTLNLLTAAFVFGFSTFLTACIDYRKVPQSKNMHEIIIPQCVKNMSWWWHLSIWVFALCWLAYLFYYIAGDIGRLWRMHNFYHYLLDIPDSEIQTVTWQIVVGRLMALRDANPATATNLSPENRREVLGNQSKQRMDAHDIANRVMRKENYVIALFNKDILDLTVPIPFLGNRQFLSRTMMLNIYWTVIEFAFDERGQLHKNLLESKSRGVLARALRRRILIAGLYNIVIGPIFVFYFAITYFYSSFTEYHRNPAELGSRSFTPLAEIKFREFNELWHLFERRRKMASPYANRYLEQFPKNKTNQLYTFVAFIAGALAAVLGVASLLDPELFLGFEITPGKTVLFWLGILGSIYAAARSAVPEDNLVLDPEFALTNVIECTRYNPASWQGRLHSDEVRREFANLYKLKIMIILEEILSMVFAPYIMIFSLPKSCERIIDFFREFTVHVDGLGHVCSFAVFDFKKGVEHPAPIPAGRQHDEPLGLRDDYYATKDDKMYTSYVGFCNEYFDERPSRGKGSKRNLPRPYIPPPVFPGLMSPPLAAGSNRHAAALRQSMHRTARFGPVANHSSPMHSALLDAHHQPSMSVTHPSHSKYRPSRLALEDPDELEEEDEPGPPIQQPTIRTSNKVIEEDSELGDSWRTTHATQLDGDDHHQENGVEIESKGAGVLGLLYQFQKARTEGRGAGVGI